MLKKREISQRTCIACRKIFSKEDMLRIVRNKKGEISIDESCKKHGRGAYICINNDCVTVVKKKNALERTFKCKVGMSIYNDLVDIIGKK